MGSISSFMTSIHTMYIKVKNQYLHVKEHVIFVSEPELLLFIYLIFFNIVYFDHVCPLSQLLPDPPHLPNHLSSCSLSFLAFLKEKEKPSKKIKLKKSKSNQIKETNKIWQRPVKQINKQKRENKKSETIVQKYH